MSRAEAETQRSSLVGDIQTMASVTSGDVPPKEEDCQAGPGSRRGIESRADVLGRLSNKDIIVINDDDDDDDKDFRQYHGSSLHTATQASVPQQDVTSIPPTTSPLTKPKRKLFSKTLISDTTKPYLDLHAPPASATESPEHRFTCGIDENEQEWSFAAVSGSVVPFLPRQRLEEISSLDKAGIDRAKQQAEVEGRQKSQALRRNKEEQRRASQNSNSRVILPPAQVVQSTQRTIENTAETQDQSLEILSSSDEDVSKAWKLRGEVFGLSPHKESTAKLNPYSSEAADEYRTQDRHLGNPVTTSAQSFSDTPQRTEEEQKQADARLNRMKQNQSFSNGKRKRSPPPKFHAPDLSGGEKRQRISMTNSLPRNNIGKPVLADAAIPNSTGLFEELNSLTAPMNVPKTKEQLQDFDSAFPPQGSEKTLRKNVIKLSGPIAEIARRRETHLNRWQDLQIISDVYQSLSHLLAITNRSEIINRWLEAAAIFTQAVLDNDRSGKLRRRRMKDILLAANKKLEDSSTKSSEGIAERLFTEMLKPEHIAILKSDTRLAHAAYERARLDADMQHSVTARNKAAHRSESNVLQKPVSARLRAQSDMSGPHTGKPSSSKDRISHYKALLARFDDPNSKPQNALDDVEMIELDFGDGQCEDDADISEEEAGEAYMKPAETISSHLGQYAESRAEQNLHIAQTTQNLSSFAELPDPSRVSAQAAYKGTQGWDEGMIERMKQKQSQQHDTESNTPACLSEDSDESDGSSENDADSESEEHSPHGESEPSHFAHDGQGNAVCWQYFVIVNTVGLRADDDFEHPFYNAYNRKEAEASLEKVPAWFRHRFRRMNPHVSLDNKSITVTTTDEEIVHQCKIYADKEYGYRASLTRRLVSKSAADAARNKSQHFRQYIQVWFVSWKKVIEPYYEDAVVLDRSDGEGKIVAATQQPSSNPCMNKNEHGEQGELQANQTSTRSTSPSDDFHSLFGDDDSPVPNSTPPSTYASDRPPVSKQVIEMKTLDALDTFSEVGGANRQAKEIFSAWFHRALPGAHNTDYHKQRDEEMEEELERIGNMSPCSFEEECVVSNPDGTKQTERMHVWVKRARHRGPTN